MEPLDEWGCVDEPVDEDSYYAGHMACARDALTECFAATYLIERA